MLEKLGKYRIDGVLGSGAMGIVYKAFDINIERVVALKTIHTDLLYDAQGEELLARFKTEAQASGRLTHAGIVTVYDFGEVDRIAYLAMEFVDGVTLNSILEANTPTEFIVAISFMRQLLLALEYAHGRGVVHRDIKPSNLMITEDGVLKITDFGIARLDASTYTQVGSVMGTPSYMSPEQLRGETVDGRTDIFAAGIIFYQLLAGNHPFRGSSAKIMEQILSQSAPNISEANPKIVPAFDQLFHKALAKNLVNRYGSARDFLEDLEELYQANRTEGTGSIQREHDRTTLALKTVLAKHRVPADTQDVLAKPNTVAITTHTPWKIEISPDVHTLLAKQVGPVARLLLKNALTQAENIDELCTQLLPHIPTENGRLQFLEGVKKAKNKLLDRTTGSGTLMAKSHFTLPAAELSKSTSQAKNTDSKPGLAAASQLQPGLTPEVLEKVEQLLTVFMGPIAKILVRKTAQQTNNRREFLHMLAEKLPTPAERSKFLRDVETKL